jgi:small subunit ribosomal protein S16
MVRIRFRRMGLKKQPTYRIVVTDQRKARNGNYLEVIGHHNPRTRPSTDVIDEARALYWMSVGAQPSDSVKRLMQRTGTMARYERMTQGEALETLVAEAEAEAAKAEPISPRTEYPAPPAGQGKKSVAAAAVTAEAVAEPAAAAVAEAAAEAEAVEEPAEVEEAAAEAEAVEEPAEAEEPAAEAEAVEEVAEAEEPAAEAEAVEEPAEAEEADDDTKDKSD